MAPIQQRLVEQVKQGRREHSKTGYGLVVGRGRRLGERDFGSFGDHEREVEHRQIAHDHGAAFAAGRVEWQAPTGCGAAAISADLRGAT
jgi:hypothetical protein